MVAPWIQPFTLAEMVDRWFGAVMLFCDRLSEQQVLEAKAASRESLLESLLNDFRKAFPDLSFELQLDFTIINAQALKLQDRLIVMIYGGSPSPEAGGRIAHTDNSSRGRTSSRQGLPFETRPLSRMRMCIGLLGCYGRNGYTFTKIGSASSDAGRA